MNKFFKSLRPANIITLLLALILVVIILITALMNIKNNAVHTSQFGSTKSNSSSFFIARVIPVQNSTLTPGQEQSFFIYISQPIQFGSLNINLTYADFTQANPKITPFGFTQSQITPTEIIIKTEQPIIQFGEYNLTVTNKANGSLLSSTNYLSDKLEPTAIPINNEILKSYLPQTTTNAMLEYVQSENIYVCHILYDPSNPETLVQQEQDAKNQCNQFIESKGVNLDTVIINYLLR